MKASKKTLPYLSTELWSMVLSECDPKSLVACMLACRLFNDLLKSPRLWSTARERTFGAGCPPPPPNMTDGQYAELTQGHGCQEPTCTDTRSRKIYWAMQMRLCTSCYRARFCPEKEIELTLIFHPGLRDCLIQHRWEGGKRYKGLNCVLDGRPIAFDRLAVDAVLAMYDSGGSQVDTNWYNAQTAMIRELVSALVACENFFQLRTFDEDQKRSEHKKELTKYLEERAMQLVPPMSAEELRYCDSFHKAIAHAKPQKAHSAVWKRLQPKLLIERSDLCQDDSDDGDLDEDIRMMAKFDEELRSLDPSEDKPDMESRVDGNMAEAPPIDEGMAGPQALTAPYAVMIPNRGSDQAASAGYEILPPTTMNISDTGVQTSEGNGNGSFLLTAMNGLDTGLGPGETNDGRSSPRIGRVPWPATVAFPWDAAHTVHPRHRDQ
ncbi:hypothetical protein MMC26_006779 [Xylographa opegraphella]|nr:hypothetical protein [Xylographa opegraphella]